MTRLDYGDMDQIAIQTVRQHQNPSGDLWIDPCMKGTSNYQQFTGFRRHENAA